MKNEAGETQILHAQMDEILTKTIREHSQKEKKLALQTWKARKKCLKLTILVLLILILLQRKEQNITESKKEAPKEFS